ncbi:hypothetical protein COLO4_28095 [Corchorus olitorius]|uniref:Uncharacterized protein n=1 Tax=Corchorus olitorius TaxID=93759 RepID=A0A1R3HN08_9ROSI|nr:hypothetical protein COLO4_28095 [Corchorus olitorius]
MIFIGDMAVDETKGDGEFIVQRGMALPHGLAVEVLRSKRNVSIPPEARASAAEEQT